MYFCKPVIVDYFVTKNCNCNKFGSSLKITEDGRDSGRDFLFAAPRRPWRKTIPTG